MSAEDRKSNPLFHLSNCAVGTVSGGTVSGGTVSGGQEVGGTDALLLLGRGPRIEIRLNGEPKTVNVETLQELLAHLHLLEKPVAVERNREIIFKEQYQNTRLDAGDAIEIIQFVGGG